MTAVLGGRLEGLTALHLDDDDLDTRARLVVIGNGMAGARFVEEVLERGGGEQFRITVFGDEPHGNYNRIMLSPVLAGEEHEDDIVLNSHDWYADNGVTLRAGVLADRIDTAAKLVHAADGTVTPYDHLVLATGSYSFIPPMKGVRTDDGELLPGVYGFRTIDETRAMLDAVGRCKKAVVMGGGLLGLEAARALQGHGLHVELVHAMPYLMNMQLDAEAGAILKRSVESLGITVHLDVFATDVRHRPRRGGRAGRRTADRRRPARRRRRRPAQHRHRRPLRAGGGARHRRRRPAAHRRPRRLRDRRVRAAPRRGLRPGRARLGAREGAGRRPHRHRPDRRVPRQPDGDEAQGRRRRRRRHGHQHPGAGRRRVPGHLRAEARGAPVGRHPRRQADRRDAARRHPQGRLPHPGLRPRAGRCPRSGSSCSSTSPTAPPRSASRRCRPTTQVCNCNGVTKGAICGAVADGCGSVGAVMDTTRAGKGCGSCKSLVKQIVEWAADGDLTEDPAASWYVPGIPMAKPELMAAIRAQDLRSVSAVFAALGAGRGRTTPSRRWA